MSLARPFVHDMKNYLGIIIGYSNLLLDELPSNDARRPDLDEILKAAEGAIQLLEKWGVAPAVAAPPAGAETK